MNESKEYEVFVNINLYERYYIEANSLEQAEELAKKRFIAENNLSDKPDILEYVYSSGGECDDNWWDGYFMEVSYERIHGWKKRR